MSEKQQEVARVAADLFKTQPDWVTFFREVMGLGGIVRQMYRDKDSLAQFEQTAEYAEIQQMIKALRQNGGKSTEQETTRVITVRMPQSLHESLKTEAHEHKTSMNQLCISKLLQFIDGELVPSEQPAAGSQAEQVPAMAASEHMSEAY